MHPTVSYELMQARVADLHRQAQRDALARAARRTSRQQSGHAVPARHGIGRMVLTVLGARSP